MRGRAARRAGRCGGGGERLRQRRNLVWLVAGSMPPLEGAGKRAKTVMRGHLSVTSGGGKTSWVILFLFLFFFLLLASSLFFFLTLGVY